MAGCRPLETSEINVICESLSVRDKAILIIGLKTGYRIQEILSLKVKNVYQFGKVLDKISVERCNMKGKDGTRVVPLHKDAKEAISQWLNELLTDNRITSDSPLFPSRKNLNKPITRIQAWRIFHNVFIDKNISGKVATHSMRKTFANNVYSKLGHDLVKTQRAMGHAQITSTARYITFTNKEIEDAILN